MQHVKLNFAYLSYCHVEQPCHCARLFIKEPCYTQLMQFSLQSCSISKVRVCNKQPGEHSQIVLSSVAVMAQCRCAVRASPCACGCRLPEVQGQLRPLDMHVLRLLGHVQATALPQAALAPAAFLLEQLQVQLVEALTRARRPAFLNTAASQDASAGNMLHMYNSAKQIVIANCYCARSKLIASSVTGRFVSFHAITVLHSPASLPDVTV